ncbi:LysR family transcriptional regulator [Mameliella alba]|nr:LysR family transcriptional regulator [Mameliella alba]MBY6175012.1 LysR family transcriptional regulator [Mameliella alba]
MKYDLNLLAVFDAIMQEQNVTAAANRLGLSQSAVSAALSRLRAAFDDELFLRARYGVVPTEKARAMAPEVSEALDRLRHVFEDRPSFDPASARRSFRIAASAYFECVVIPSLMARVTTDAPRISLVVEPLGPDLDTKALAAGDLNIALGRFDNAPDSLVISPLMEDGFLCLLRKDDLPGQHSVTKEQYESLPHVVVSPPGKWRTGLGHTLGTAGLTRHVALTVSHFLAAPLAVAEIGGLVTLPTRIARIYENDPAFRLLPPPVDLGQFPMQVAWHPRHRSDPGHRWLRDVITEVCASI